MFRSNFPETNHFEAQMNPNHTYYYLDDDDFGNYLYNHQEFDLSNYFGFDQPINKEDYYSSSSFSNNNACLSQSPVTQEMTSTESVDDSSLEGLPENTNISQEITRAEDGNNDDEHRVVAFRVQTKLESLDDGYKWRKYGKKKVKSNSNPRNYYKCTSERCKVKKRVERDPRDSSYVITTYEGVHTHQSPTQITHTQSTHPFTLHITESEWNSSGAHHNNNLRNN